MTDSAPNALARRAVRAAQLGAVVNALLAGTKLVAGLAGHSGALVADAVESSADVVGSLLVWGGLTVALRPPDTDHPYGHGRADTLAGAAVALLLVVAALGIAVESIQEIRTPHEVPAPWTLGVLVGVVIVKGLMSRFVRTLGSETGSSAVQADAWHHLSDAVTSGAAFVGIAVALWGSRHWGGIGWAAADDWAALAAAGVIGFNGWLLLRPAVDELMDRAPEPAVLGAVRATAEAVPGVRAVETLTARKVGTAYRVVAHVQADPGMSLEAAHALGHGVQVAVQRAVPRVQSVLVHMEPYAPGRTNGGSPGAPPGAAEPTAGGVAHRA